MLGKSAISKSEITILTRLFFIIRKLLQPFIKKRCIINFIFPIIFSSPFK